MGTQMKIPPCIIQIIRNMYINNKGIVCIDDQEKCTFAANTGVKQGDGASPKLFNIFFDQVYPYLLKYFDEHMVAATTRYILEIATLQIFFLAFADDAVLLSHSAAGLQHMLNAFNNFC